MSFTREGLLSGGIEGCPCPGQEKLSGQSPFDAHHLLHRHCHQLYKYTLCWWCQCITHTQSAGVTRDIYAAVPLPVPNLLKGATALCRLFTTCRHSPVDPCIGTWDN